MAQVRRHLLLIATLLSVLTACATEPVLSGADKEAIAASREHIVPIEALNPDVRQETIQQTICVPGYTATVRPSTTYMNRIKLKLMYAQSLPTEGAASLELDHRVPLALGGHPRNLKNLMLQPWEGDAGAKRKDQLERRLQILVCAGKVLLNDARSAIYVDWQQAYVTYVMAR